MKVEHITAPGAPTPGGSYSHGVVANGFLYTCGMGPADPDTGEVVAGGLAEQTRQTLKNLQKILDVKGAKFSDVVKVTPHRWRPASSTQISKKVSLKLKSSLLPTW